MRRTDVDLLGGTVTVSEQIVQLGWATEGGVPKTGGGARIVALDAETLEGAARAPRPPARRERSAR